MKNNERDTGGWWVPLENWTKTPNEFFDRLPDYQSPSEFIVLAYILRHTWGFQEFDSEDGKVITMDEFENGRKRKDGTRLDRGTGLSQSAIRSGLKQAEDDNLIIVTVDDSDKARIKKAYRLAMRGVEFAVRGTELTPPPSEKTPRTEKETIERNKRKITTPSPNGDDAPEPVNGKKPRTPAQLASDRIQGISAVMASYHHNWAFDPFIADDWTPDFVKAVGVWRGTASKGTAGQIATTFDELTPQEFKAFFEWYETTYPDRDKLSTVNKVGENLLKWRRAQQQQPTQTSIRILNHE